jgi:hypothetical protein
MLGASALRRLKWAETGFSDAKSSMTPPRTSKSKPNENIAPRDAVVPVVTQGLRDAHILLLVPNHDNPKALGDFGCVADDSPQNKAKAQPMT